MTTKPKPGQEAWVSLTRHPTPTLTSSQEELSTKEL